MKKLIFLLLAASVTISLFAFNHLTTKKKTLDHKWFRYRTGEMGVPAIDASNAKVAAYYALVGSSPYCGGTDEFCGIFAEPTDETGSALPIIDVAEEDDIDDFFDSPENYTGSLVDRTIDN